MILAIFRRRRREGRDVRGVQGGRSTTQGFGVPTRVLTAERLDDPREILSIGCRCCPFEDLGSIAERSSENESQRHSRIDAVIDSTERRAFYVLCDEDDLS